MVRFAHSFLRRQSPQPPVLSQLLGPLTVALVALMAGASSPPVSAASQQSLFSTVTLVVPGYTTTRPADVNNRGDVVGSANNCDSGPGVGFIYRDGIYTIISVPGADATHLTDINERGIAIGYAWIPDASGALIAHSFIVNDGMVTPLASSDMHVLANGINARGDVVGVIPRRTFLRDARGRVVFLAPPPGVDAIFGAEITASGTIVGTAHHETSGGTRFSGFVIEGGRFTLLPQFSSVEDVNERGDVLATEGFAFPQVYRKGALVNLPDVDGRLSGISNTWAVGSTTTVRPGPDGPCFDAVGFLTRLPGGRR